MASVGESSSVPPASDNGEKPVVVRVKRKLGQSVVDAFWLEINEQPSKRAALDMAKLSLGVSDDGTGEDHKPRKVLVQHVETIRTSESAISVVQSFVPNSADMAEPKATNEELKRVFKSVNKQEQILSKSKLSQEKIARSARFKQIWSSRKESEEGLHDMCNFYDIVRLDAEEQSSQVKQKDALSLEDQKLLSSYLPFLKELLPNAAEEIEAEISASTSQGDDYVYDYYTVNDSMGMDVEHDKDMSILLPLVQVEEVDFYDGPDDESECASENSNAENHPFNDYPDESSEEEDELQSEDGSNADGDDEEGEDEGNDDDESRSLENFGEDCDVDYFEEDYPDEAVSSDYDDLSNSESE